MDPQQLMAQGQQMIIEELGLTHLPVSEQEEILDELGIVLFERVLLKLISLLPQTERDAFGKHFASQDISAMQALIDKYIPNSQDVIKTELRAGIEEHKRLVAEEVAKK